MKHIKIYESFLQDESLNESWKNWVIGGFLVLTTVGGLRFYHLSSKEKKQVLKTITTHKARKPEERRLIDDMASIIDRMPESDADNIQRDTILSQTDLYRETQVGDTNRLNLSPEIQQIVTDNQAAFVEYMKGDSSIDFNKPEERQKLLDKYNKKFLLGKWNKFWTDASGRVKKFTKKQMRKIVEMNPGVFGIYEQGDSLIYLEQSDADGHLIPFNRQNNK